MCQGTGGALSVCTLVHLGRQSLERRVKQQATPCGRAPVRPSRAHWPWLGAQQGWTTRNRRRPAADRSRQRTTRAHENGFDIGRDLGWAPCPGHLGRERGIRHARCPSNSRSHFNEPENIQLHIGTHLPTEIGTQPPRPWTRKRRGWPGRRTRPANTVRHAGRVPVFESKGNAARCLVYPVPQYLEQDA